MGVDHKRPLYAFMVVASLCAFLMVGSVVRADSPEGIFHRAVPIAGSAVAPPVVADELPEMEHVSEVELPAEIFAASGATAVVSAPTEQQATATTVVSDDGTTPVVKPSPGKASPGKSSPGPGKGTKGKGPGKGTAPQPTEPPADDKATKKAERDAEKAAKKAERAAKKAAKKAERGARKAERAAKKGTRKFGKGRAGHPGKGRTGHPGKGRTGHPGRGKASHPGKGRGRGR